MTNDWRTIPRELHLQIGNGHPNPTGEMTSVEAFKARFPNYETSVTTICDPHLWDWTAETPKGRLWISVSDREVHPEDWK